jgi:hypothetical protein
MAMAERAGNGVRRIVLAWRALAPDQRMAALAALGLLVSMFLPWYEKSVYNPQARRFVSDTVSAFGVVSFVEASVGLIAIGVLVLLFARAENRAFHLPGGDGTIIFAAGLWAALLIFYRVFDRPTVHGNAGTVGIQWGFFIAFIAAGALAAAGQRIRSAHRPEPALPEEHEPVPARGPAGEPRRRARPRPPVDARPAPPPEYRPPERGRTEPPPPPPPRADTQATAPAAGRRAGRRPAAGPDAPTSIAGQLSFDEAEDQPDR